MDVVHNEIDCFPQFGCDNLLLQTDLDKRSHWWLAIRATVVSSGAKTWRIVHNSAVDGAWTGGSCGRWVIVPYELQYAVCLHIIMPTEETGVSPVEAWTRTA